MWPLWNGRKSMGNWGEITLLTRVLTPFTIGRGPSRGIKHCKRMVIWRDCPVYNALFRLVIQLPVLKHRKQLFFLWDEIHVIKVMNQMIWLFTPWDSKDYYFECFSRKDHCFTNDFQLTNPGDRYFHSLGLAGHRTCKNSLVANESFIIRDPPSPKNVKQRPTLQVVSRL